MTQTDVDAATGTDEVAGQAVRFHPQAVRPNFLWKAQLPTRWALLETHPASWELKLERIINGFFFGKKLRAADKRVLKKQLSQAVKAAQDNKVLLFLFVPGATEDGEVACVSLLLRWQNSSPNTASIKGAEQAFAHKTGVTRKTTASGNAYVAFSDVAQTGPLTDRRDVYSHQAFLPIPGTTWTLAISGSAPSADVADQVSDVVERVANSVEAFPETAGQRLVEDQADAVSAAVPGAGELRADEDTAQHYVPRQSGRGER